MNTPCFNCRAPLADGLLFCPACGTAITKSRCPDCQALTKPSATHCHGCRQLLPMLIWAGPLDELAATSRFLMIQAVGTAEAWVRDHVVPAAKQPTTAGPLPAVHWRSETAMVTLPPLGADGRLLGTLDAAWDAADAVRRLELLLGWLALYEALPEGARRLATYRDRLHVDGRAIRLRHPAAAEPAALSELLACWLPLLDGAPEMAKTRALVRAAAEAPEPSVKPLRQALEELAQQPVLRWRHAATTDVGRCRQGNEDNFVALTVRIEESRPAMRVQFEGGLYAVFDGMGGHEAGEVASSLVAEAVRRELASWLLQPGSFETDAVSNIAGIIQGPINEAVWRVNKAQGGPDSRGMGTTLVALIARGDQALRAHVGDSRLYRLTATAFERLTQDQNVAMATFAAGGYSSQHEAEAFARTAAGKALMQAVGVRAGSEVAPEIAPVPLAPPCVFLLCSDGLSDLVPETEMAASLRPLLTAPEGLDAAAHALVASANKAGGKDNITVMLVHVASATY
jgi:serine/threonine protein phosphatase PrpC